MSREVSDTAAIIDRDGSWGSLSFRAEYRGWVYGVVVRVVESSGNFYSLHNIPYMTFIYNISFSQPPAFAHLDRPHSILSTLIEQASSPSPTAFSLPPIPNSSTKSTIRR